MLASRILIRQALRDSISKHGTRGCRAITCTASARLSLKPVPAPQPEDEYVEKVARHRPLMQFKEKIPSKAFENMFVAPNATVVGDVTLVTNVSVWYGAVIRGDENTVKVNHHTSIGDKTIISTVSKLSTGLPSYVDIGVYTIIEAGCTLTSCVVGSFCKLGLGTVVGQGSVIEDQVTLLPGTVVPPDYLIPAGQIWGGNPAAFIADQDDEYKTTAINEALKIVDSAKDHLDEFNPHGMAFLQAEALAARGVEV